MTLFGTLSRDIPSTLIFTLLALAIVPIFIAIRNVYFHPLSKVPGPPAWAASRLPFIRSLLRGTIIQDFEKLHRKYGPVVRIAPNELTFAKREAWNDILQPRPGVGTFLKDPTWWAAQPGMALTLLSAIQPKPHAHIRNILAPAFTLGALKEQESIIFRYVSLLVERLHDLAVADDGGGGSDSERKQSQGAELDIGPWFNYTTFDILGDLAFGESFTCLENSKYHPWIKLVYDSVKAATWVASARFFPPVQYVIIKLLSPLLQKMQRQHLNHIAGKVERRLNWELERPDIMSHVIRRGPAEKTGLPRDQLNGTFMVLANAGSETSATALTGAVNYLVNCPDKLQLLVREIRGSFERETDMTLEALRKLPYLNATLHETLRLCPPISWILPRCVPRGGATVCGVWVPEGTSVSIQAYAMNRSPTYFHDSTTFAPERWLPQAKEDPTSPFFRDEREAVQPFAVGPRNCMGRHLAWAEMRLVLSRLLFALDLEVVGGAEVRWEDLRTFLFVEKKPIRVRIKAREE